MDVTEKAGLGGPAILGAMPTYRSLSGQFQGPTIRPH
jgi:hypothetical protein